MGNLRLHTLSHPTDELFFNFPPKFMRTEPLEVSGYPSSGIHHMDATRFLMLRFSFQFGKDRKLMPDVITYNAAINACAQSGECAKTTAG